MHVAQPASCTSLRLPRALRSPCPMHLPPPPPGPPRPPPHPPPPPPPSPPPPLPPAPPSAWPQPLRPPASSHSAPPASCTSVRLPHALRSARVTLTAALSSMPTAPPRMRAV